MLPLFVEFLLKDLDDDEQLEDFENVSIMTTTFPLSMKITVPKNKQHLKELLLETARIPLAMSKASKFEDIVTTDGGFSMLSHFLNIKFDELIMLPMTFEMCRNFLNTGVDIETCMSIYQQGIERGCSLPRAAPARVVRRATLLF